MGSWTATFQGARPRPRPPHPRHDLRDHPVPAPLVRLRRRLSPPPLRLPHALHPRPVPEVLPPSLPRVGPGVLQRRGFPPHGQPQPPGLPRPLHAAAVGRALLRRGPPRRRLHPRPPGFARGGRPGQAARRRHAVPDAPAPRRGGGDASAHGRPTRRRKGRRHNRPPQGAIRLPLARGRPRGHEVPAVLVRVGSSVGHDLRV
mmetsp:Transcript_2793/g.5844  ORF Transcript_2793/g.5844 Transcript_2793/m.5844 type:complete len:202 (+) Transcript_2793:580-1185(+)